MRRWSLCCSCKWLSIGIIDIPKGVREQSINGSNATASIISISSNSFLYPQIGVESV